jgi:hypothetical protein
MRDITLAYMRLNLPREQRTLETYVDLNWFGDKSLHDICQEAELIMELPIELVWSFLAFGDASDLDVEDLVALRSRVDGYELEEERP